MVALISSHTRLSVSLLNIALYRTQPWTRHLPVRSGIVHLRQQQYDLFVSSGDACRESRTSTPHPALLNPQAWRIWYFHKSDTLCRPGLGCIFPSSQIVALPSRQPPARFAVHVAGSKIWTHHVFIVMLPHQNYAAMTPDTASSGGLKYTSDLRFKRHSR